MAEGMTEMQLMVQERQYTGTAWTKNKDFDKHGDLVVKDDSIYIMPSGQFQFKYKHAVEPMKSGKRISLTFRHIPKERI